MKDLHILGLLYESIYKDRGVKGLGEFLYRLTDTHPYLEPHLQIIRDTIINSGCPEIKIMPLKMALGASLKKFVLVSPALIKSPPENCLYALFHEIAHQYQYKKYGDKIAQMFLNRDDSTKEEDAKYLAKIENVADQFGMRKCRELASKGILMMDRIRTVGAYANFTTEDFIQYLDQMRKVLRTRNITNPEEVDDIFYEYITGQVIQKLETA